MYGRGNRGVSKLLSNYTSLRSSLTKREESAISGSTVATICLVIGMMYRRYRVVTEAEAQAQIDPYR